MSGSASTILAFATKGPGTNEEHRLRRLLGGLHTSFEPFDRRKKVRTFCRLFAVVRRTRPDLLVMEGSGISGGVVCLLTHILFKQRYVVSSGDAVGPFVAGVTPWLGPAFGLYERLLCRFAAGFIGWTPYLTGRALTFGVRRAMTAPGWSEQSKPSQNSRSEVRAALGIPADSIVFGLVGSLVWNSRYKYCYGMELVEALTNIERTDIRVLIIGDGTGLKHLRDRAGDRLGNTILLPGSVPPQKTVDYMAAMDVGSLPQSVDGVGSFRYTTKISEYLAASLPISTGQIPLAYDLDGGWAWRLPGDSPWSRRYVTALRDLMNRIRMPEIEAHKRAIPEMLPMFEPNRQILAVTDFVSDLLEFDPRDFDDVLK